jgi:hypothetical protein
MKKLLIIFCCLFLIVGCTKKKEEVEEDQPKEKFVLTKVDETKDYIYLTDYKSVKVSNKTYDLKFLTINIKSSAADNVNLELKSFVQKSFDDYLVYDGRLVQGRVIDYEYYKTDKYISIIQRYYMTVDTMHGDEDYNSYVISLEDGELVNRDKLLKEYNHSENDIYELLEKQIDSEDKDYIISQIKKEGFDLCVDEDNNLMILYRVINDDESIIKKLVLS